MLGSSPRKTAGANFALSAAYPDAYGAPPLGGFQSPPRACPAASALTVARFGWLP